MAEQGNSVVLVGNITQEPELRYTANRQAVTNFSMAVNRRWKDKDSNEWSESTSYFEVVCWGTLGENVAESVTKGSRVIVNGRLEQQTWEVDGQKRYAVKVIADEVAPSLRWATATVVKAERKSADNAVDKPAAINGPVEEPF